MIAGYNMSQELLSALPDDVRDQLQIAASPAAFKKLLCFCHGGVVRLPYLDAAAVEWLRTLTRDCPLRFLVLIPEFSSENIQRTTALPPSTLVVWPDTPTDDLAARLRELCHGGAMDNICRHLAAKPDVSPLVLGAIELICRDASPPTSVVGLASKLGCAESTLRQRWQAEVAEDVSLKALLDWALLLRAVRLAGGQDWGQRLLWKMARTLKVSTRTLRRLGPRCVGMPTQECVLHDDAVESAFRDWARVTGLVA